MAYECTEISKQTETQTYIETQTHRNTQIEITDGQNIEKINRKIQLETEPSYHLVNINQPGADPE